jgi:hypothetical protein
MIVGPNSTHAVTTLPASFKEKELWVETDQLLERFCLMIKAIKAPASTALCGYPWLRADFLKNNDRMLPDQGRKIARFQ